MIRAYRIVALVAGVGALAACGNADKAPSGGDYTGPRFTSAEHHFSIHELPQWKETRERGSVVFVYTGEGLERSTISIRAVAIRGEWTEPRTPELVIPAAERVLQALPGARVSPAHDVARADFRAVEWTMTFEPPDLGGRKYERRHFTLIGDKYIFHVIHTAPAGELAGTAATFQKVVDSLKEEVS